MDILYNSSLASVGIITELKVFQSREYTYSLTSFLIQVTNMFSKHELFININ